MNCIGKGDKFSNKWDGKPQMGSQESFNSRGAGAVDGRRCWGWSFGLVRGGELWTQVNKW